MVSLRCRRDTNFELTDDVGEQKGPISNLKSIAGSASIECRYPIPTRENTSSQNAMGCVSQDTRFQNRARRAQGCARIVFESLLGSGSPGWFGGSAGCIFTFAVLAVASSVKSNVIGGAVGDRLTCVISSPVQVLSGPSKGIGRSVRSPVFVGSGTIVRCIIE
jgi:hypothetical protein